MAKISIIIPVYNSEKYLRSALDSLIAQTFKEWEAIIIDDGSEDESGMICDEYTSRDNRFKTIHTENKGVSEARNLGIRLSTGKYIGFLDSDDWLSDKTFEVLYNGIVDHDADIASCKMVLEYPEKKELLQDQNNVGCKLFNRDDAIHNLMKENIFHNFLWDKLYKKELMVHKFPQGRQYEDLSILAKLFSETEKVLFVPYVGYHYRQRAGSIVHDDSPDNRYHWIMAQYERLQYILSDVSVDADMRNEFIYDFIKKTLPCSRDLARKFKLDRHSKSLLQSIADMLRPYAGETKELSKKHQRRLKMLLDNPIRFGYIMKLQSLFHRFKRKRMQHLYS